MSDHIVLDAEVLRAQSSQMQKLSSEYSDLFKAVQKSLKLIDNSFSSKMSNRFIPKINAAQKSFESIVQSMQNGAAAAMLGVEAFNETGSVNMSDMLEEASDSNWISKAFPNGPGVKGAFKTFLESKNITGQTLIDIMDKIDGKDYSSALKTYDYISQRVIAPMITGNFLKSNVADSIDGPVGAILKAGVKAQNEMVESVLYHIPRDIGDVFHAVLQDDTTSGDAAKLFGQVLWHYGGAPLEGGFNLGADIAKGLFPGTVAELESTGANPDSGISLAGHAIGKYLSEELDDNSYLEAYSMFDNDMGKAVMDAFEDIGNYGSEKFNEFIDNVGLHSVLK